MQPPITDVDRRAPPRAPRRAWGRALLHLGLALLALAGFVFLLQREAPSPGVEVVLRDPPPGVDEIRVYLSGAVHEPGVVTVDPGERVIDAIERAGGATAEADLLAVNLARRVADEDHVHIPVLGEAAPLVDLNAAPAAELEMLPGIGPVRAAQIVDARTTQSFGSTDDLVERGILPASIYAQLRDLITVRVEMIEVTAP